MYKNCNAYLKIDYTYLEIYIQFILKTDYKYLKINRQFCHL